MPPPFCPLPQGALTLESSTVHSTYGPGDHVTVVLEAARRIDSQVLPFTRTFELEADEAQGDAFFVVSDHCTYAARDAAEAASAQQAAAAPVVGAGEVRAGRFDPNSYLVGTSCLPVPLQFSAPVLTSPSADFLPPACSGC